MFDDSDIRKNQYIHGIGLLLQRIRESTIQKYKVIVIDNTGVKLESYLHSPDYDVFYTYNNGLWTSNKGRKELQDIFDCIQHYCIRDTDFIVKMTGRYKIQESSEFMTVIRDIEHVPYDCVIKYGSYSHPVDYKVNDCITGLIGMSCYYVKQIQMPEENECLEWKWAEVTQQMDDRNIYMVRTLGVEICPASNSYFLV